MIKHISGFLSTLSLRRATCYPVGGYEESFHFYPRSPCGERQLTACQNGQLHDFYPRSPCGERPSISIASNFKHAFLSTLSLRRATPTTRRHDQNNVFLSTLSLRRATRRHRGNDRCPVDFYPRSPCGERHQLKRRFRRANAFLSTLSLRRATPQWLPWLLQLLISIHALLAESDFALMISRRTFANFYPRSPCGERRHYLAQPQARHNFYPRSPCGERPSSVLMALPSYIFLSTLSLRRATTNISDSLDSTNQISIHALLAESDLRVIPFLTHQKLFLSTLSLRRATAAGRFLLS